MRLDNPWSKAHDACHPSGRSSGSATVDHHFVQKSGPFVTNIASPLVSEVQEEVPRDATAARRQTNQSARVWPRTSLAAIEKGATRRLLLRGNTSLEVVRLQKNKDTPSSKERVVVTRESLGADISEGPIVEHEGGATFYVPHLATKQQYDDIMNSAQHWAVRHGLNKVYVQD